MENIFILLTWNVLELYETRLFPVQRLQSLAFGGKTKILLERNLVCGN